MPKVNALETPFRMGLMGRLEVIVAVQFVHRGINGTG
jgi:hypothetical protein